MSMITRLKALTAPPQAAPDSTAITTPPAAKDSTVIQPLPAAKDSLVISTPKPVTAAPGTSLGTETPMRRQDRYELQVDLIACRIYVVNKETGEPVDRYLTSPGRKEFPTQGTSFTIQNALVKAPWNPPKSAWAKNAKVVPGGMSNPMGIFKMSLGGYSEYIHGVPASERKDLGRPASHGCLRMSNENVLQLFQQYAGVGTKVTINRSAKESQRLKAAFEAKGLKDHAITDGAELVAAAAAGKAPKPLS